MTEPITTDRLQLRLAMSSDIPEILEFFERNRAFLRPWEPERSEWFYTEEFWETRIERSAREAREGLSLRLFILPADGSQRVMGTVSFTQIVREPFHACSLGYSLSEECQGNGYMREALTGSIAYVFDESNLHRVMANYLPHNLRSGRLLRALGFTVEGYARDYLRIDGRWEDHVLTSFTNPRWRPTSTTPTQ